MASNQETKLEKGARIYRNFNILGAIAFAAAAEFIPVAGVLAGINIVQAAGGEAVRQIAKGSRKKKSKS